MQPNRVDRSFHCRPIFSNTSADRFWSTSLSDPETPGLCCEREERETGVMNCSATQPGFSSIDDAAGTLASEVLDFERHEMS